MAIMTVKSVSKEILEIAQKAATNSGAKKVILFGSRSSGPASADSDLDLLLLFDENVSMLAATAKAQQAFWHSKLDLDLVPMRLSHFEGRASVLARAIANQLQPQLGSRYISDVTTYTLVEKVAASPRFVPDVVVLEREKRPGGNTAVAVRPAPLTNTALLEFDTTYARLDIRTIDSNVLVTAIEVLSPANKRAGQDGAEAYEKKRQELFKTSAHLLE